MTLPDLERSRPVPTDIFFHNFLTSKLLNFQFLNSQTPKLLPVNVCQHIIHGPQYGQQVGYGIAFGDVGEHLHVREGGSADAYPVR